MTQEEKAKAYDEDLEKAKTCYQGGLTCLEDIFPELKESENEKIRKRLIAMCQHYIECYSLDPYNVDDYKEALAWLEKQGKQKSAWSKEDENMLGDIEEAIMNYWYGDTQDILLEWLASIKEDRIN